MKNSIHLNIIKNRYQLKNKLAVFLLLVMGVAMGCCSLIFFFNFWDRMYYILCSDFYNCFLILAIGINSIYVKDELLKSYNFVSRYGDYKNLIKNSIKSLKLGVIFLCFISFILVLAGCFLTYNGSFAVSKHEYYNIDVTYYLIYYIIRNLIILYLLTKVIFLSSCLLKNKLALLLLLIVSVLLLIPNQYPYSFIVSYTVFFTGYNFSTITMDVIWSIVHILFLLGLGSILYKITVSKKRDLL